MQTTRFNLCYAAHFEIKNKLVLRVGFTGGYVKRTIDWDKLTFGDLIDPRYGFIYPTTENRPPSSKSFFDFGIGTVAYMENFYAGFALDHLNQPDQSFIRSAPGSKLPVKIMANAGFHFPIGDHAYNISINPDLVFLNQRDFNMTIASVTARLNYMLIGMGLKFNSGPVFIGGLEGKLLRITYSYDYSNSLLANKKSGSHEFLLAFKIHGVHPKKGNWTPINLEAI